MIRSFLQPHLKKVGIAFFSLAIMLFANFNTALAFGIMGTDISYRAIDSLKFEVTLRVFRNCSGSAFSPSVIRLNLRCSDSSKTVALSPTRVLIRDVTPICKTANSPCYPQNTGFTGDGYELHVFKDTFDLTDSKYKSIISNCCEVLIEFNYCCRNSNIITGSAGQNFYTYALINICKAPKLSSPEFVNNPMFDLCCNQPVYTNVGVRSASSLDSLSYAFDSVQRSYKSAIAYNSGYSFNRPLKSYDPTGKGIINQYANPPIGFYLDPSSGEMIWTPLGCNDLGPIVVKVSQWRKDSSGTYQLVGIVRQDVIYTVKTCPSNNPPTIIGPYIRPICGESTSCFDIETDDKVKVPPPPLPRPDPDTVTISWDNGIPGASFTVLSDTVLHQTGRFCWTTNSSDVRDRPYSFVVSARDNACPVNFVSQRAFHVWVDDEINDTISVKKVGCGAYELNAILDSNSSKKGFSFYWSVINPENNAIINDPKIIKFKNGKVASYEQKDSLVFSKNGKYVVRFRMLGRSACDPNFIELYDTLDVREVIGVKMPNDTSLCCLTSKLDLKTLEKDSFKGGDWYSSRDPTIISDGHIFNKGNICDTVENVYSLAYQLVDSTTGCSDTDSFNITLRSKVPVALSDQTYCAELGELNPNKFGLTKSAVNWADYTYIWSCSNCPVKIWSDIYSDTGNAPIFNIDPKRILVGDNSIKNIDLRLSLIDSNGCSSEDSMTLTVYGVPRIDRSLFQGSDPYFICRSENSILLQQNNYPSKWRLKRGGLIEFHELNIDTISAGDETLYLSAGTYCSQDSVNLQIYEPDTIQIVPGDTSLVSGLNLFVPLGLVGWNEGEINWFTTSEAGLEEKSGIKNKVDLPRNTSNGIWSIPVWIEISNANPCMNKVDTTFFDLRPDPCNYFIFNKKGNILQLFAEKNGAINYYWQLSDGRSSNAWDENFIFPTWNISTIVKLSTVTAFHDSCTVTKTVDFSSQSNIGLNHLIIYPNPVNSQIMVNGIDSDMDCNYSIIDAVGRLVQGGKFDSNTIDCSALIEGWYVLCLNGDWGEMRKTFVIRR